MSAQISDFYAPLPERLYWDASFLVHAVFPGGRYHRECYAFLDRLSSAETSNTLCYVSSLTLDETFFALIRLKVIESSPNTSFWEAYNGDHRVILPHITDLEVLLERLMVDPRVRIAGTMEEDPLAMLDRMSQYAFLPRDAMHLAVMARLGIDSIATTDDDFAPVDGLSIITCNPRMLSRK